MSNLHFLKVKVVRIDEDRHKFIVEHEGKIYQVSQLAFQRQQPKPDFIDCIYYQTDNGGIYMSQNIQRLMQERYKIGDEVEFQIKYIKDDKFVLEDNYGFTALMNWIPTINSALTPRVKCQILNILQKNMEVRFISTLVLLRPSFRLRMPTSHPLLATASGTLRLYALLSSAILTSRRSARRSAPSFSTS